MIMKVDKNVKQLIKICSKNIKGLTKKEEIDCLLPIETGDFTIKKEERALVIYKDKKFLGDVWVEVGCYSNLDILKIITKEYGIEPKNNSITELMKYKYLIDNILLEEV